MATLSLQNIDMENPDAATIRAQLIGWATKGGVKNVVEVVDPLFMQPPSEENEYCWQDGLFGFMFYAIDADGTGWDCSLPSRWGKLSIYVEPESLPKIMETED